MHCIYENFSIKCTFHFLLIQSGHLGTGGGGGGKLGRGVYMYMYVLEELWQC